MLRRNNGIKDFRNNGKMEPLSIIASFVVSYLANNIPTITDFVKNNKGFESRMKDCYDRARKQWKCKAARDRYEGREMKYLADLQEYVAGRMDNIDPELQELLGRWVIEMRKDPVCTGFINDIKLEEVKSANIIVVNEILAKVESLNAKLDSIAGKIDGTHKATEELNRQVEEGIQKAIAKIDGLSATVSRNEVILREVYELIQNEANHVIFCTGRVLTHGGVDWWGMIENKRELRKQIELLHAFMQEYQVYFSKTFFDEVMAYYELSITLQDGLDSLVMAIATADGQDGITDVYYITYEQKIDWTADFVGYMMDEFQKVDKHPAYGEYARLYKEHEESSNSLLTQIEQKSGKVI